jgi:uncharacterized repeat protein (TIGR03803 family)
LLRDKRGNLYGTTFGGGSNSDGTIFQFTPAGALNVLHSFNNDTGGGQPESGLVMDAGGNLYGTTMNWGENGFGTVFELDAADAFRVLHNFTGHDDGGFSYGNLFLETDGALYGSTTEGAGGLGNIFRILSNGKVANGYSFRTGKKGNYPSGDLISDEGGHLFGVASQGGKNDGGTVYMLRE